MVGIRDVARAKTASVFLIGTVLLLIGVAYAYPSVGIISPQNGSTVFNRTICINATSNESISEWRYNLDNQGNVTFTPPTYLNLTQGSHHLEVWAYNGSIWNYNTSDFIVAYVVAHVYEEDTNEPINTTVKILNATTYLELASAEAINGEANLSGFEYGTYIVSFGKANSDYPYIRRYTFTFDQANESVEGYLIKTGEGSPVTWQVVDGFYGNPIEGATVKFYKGGKLLDEIKTDSYGTVTEYMILSTYYCISATKESYRETYVCYAPTQSAYALTMLKEELETIQAPAVTLILEPKGHSLVANRTYYFAMKITDSESKLVKYGIVVGANPDIIKDPEVPFDGVTKILMASGTNPSGDYIVSSGFDLHDWYGDKLYVGYYYQREGEDITWFVKEFEIAALAEGQPMFYPIKEALANIVYGLGFKGDLPLVLIAIFTTGIISSTASLRMGTLMGVATMFMMLGFWVMCDILDKWTFIVAMIINGALIHYVGRVGGLEY